MEARRMIVKGRVQGVGFRYYVYRQADALGTKGWVRNLPNGDVEVHAEGELDILSEFERRVGRGPSFSFVTEFEASRSVFMGHKTFEIRS